MAEVRFSPDIVTDPFSHVAPNEVPEDVRAELVAPLLDHPEEPPTLVPEDVLAEQDRTERLVLAEAWQRETEGQPPAEDEPGV
jgi:hypothetical protein